MKITRRIISLAIILALSLSIAVSANATWSTGFENADLAIKLGIIEPEDFDPYDTVSVGQFTDMLSKAYNGSSADITVSGADKPASIGFIATAFEQATGVRIGDAPFWRYLSSGEYIAMIEAINLIIQTPVMG